MPATDEPQEVELQEIAGQLADDFLPRGWERVSSSAYSRVAHNAGLQLYCKEFRRLSPALSVRARLRGSRATRARENAELLRYHGIDAPEAVHWGTLPAGSEFLFTRAAPGEPIDCLLADTELETAQRRTLFHDLGRFIGRLHATGFIHGDCRAAHIIARRHESRYQFTLLDNERIRLRKPPPGRDLLADLVQLNLLPPLMASKTDRMRVFRAWHDQMCHLTEEEAKIIGGEACRGAAVQVEAGGR